MLLVVGVTPGFTASKARREINAKRIHRISQGIYCETSDMEDFPRFMRAHALRIVNHMFENATVIGSSAYFKAPVATLDRSVKGKYTVFLASTYSRVINLDHLSVVIRQLPQTDAMRTYCLPYTDGREAELGQMSLRVASDELVYLQSFEPRRHNLDRFLDDRKVSELRLRLEEKHGVDLLRVLGRIAEDISDLRVEFEGAARDLAQTPDLSQDWPAFQHEFDVTWYKHEVGKITHDGTVWRFDYDTGWLLPLSCAVQHGRQIPAFILNALPQGAQQEAIQEELSPVQSTAAILATSERFLCNLTILAPEKRGYEVPFDRLYGRLRDHVDEHGVFLGMPGGIPEMDENFAANVKALIVRSAIPRLSGFQPKIPMHLAHDGQMWPAERDAFTHILKLPGLHPKGNDIIRGVLEWTSMTLARAGGLNTCDFAITTLSNDSVAFIAERFDIPTSEKDERHIFSEEFNAAMGYAPPNAVLESIEHACDLLRKNSTSFREDAKQMYMQICSSLILENGDMHLKNLSFVKEAAPSLDRFETIRLSPAYDIMTTKFFGDALKDPAYPEPVMLKVNGKHKGILQSDLHEVAKRLDLSPSEADDIMYDFCFGVAQKARAIYKDFPEIIARDERYRKIAVLTLQRAFAIIDLYAPDALTAEASARPVNKLKRR